MIAHQNSDLQKPARVVLLGGHGFIGRAIRARLESEGMPFVAPTSGELNLADLHAADKLSAVINPTDSVVMLAALTPDKGRDVAALMQNLAMMQSVCAALGKTGCAHFVYISSDAVYDPEVSRIADETPASPRDLYGTMHCTREIMARSLSGVPVLVLRPTLVYGPADTHNSYGPNRFRCAAQKDGKIILFGGGEERRDHIYVDDVAALAVRCLLQKSTGALNVATGTSRSFYEIAEIVAKQFGKCIEIATTPRVSPVTHRHYDVTGVIKAFPLVRFTLPEDGIARVHAQTLGVA